jgi:hypothetical protein
MAEVPEYALVYHYGDSFDGITWQWKDSAGIAKDISTYTADLKVKTDSGTEVLHLTSSPASGLSIPVGTDGKVVLSVSPTIMMAGTLVEGTTYEYDVQVKSSDGSIIKTLTKGPFRVDKQVTDV